MNGKIEKSHRWIVDEPEVPFELTILYEDSNIIVVDKPHFLATTPRGMWYRQTALVRLRKHFKEPQITPAHRLDRQTAGVVLFVCNPKLRGDYQMLFQEHHVEKTYECLAPAKLIARPPTGIIQRLEPPAVFPLKRRSHIVKNRGRLQAYEVPGTVNAETVIELGETDGDIAAEGYRRYILHPKTGKTHQLRVHMNSLGLPIKGDDLYPEIIEPDYTDFSNPLQLVARSLSFIDPISHEPRTFVSQIPLG
ncbi:MAG: 23S rRNA pseudouridylate synthase [Bifidobacterium sp.]|nr:23S rRNA pseudouridylate synthase [Bifidobacterium sp.]